MSARESAFTFSLDGDTLIGVLHRPAGAARLGVVMVVGGPQYRVGGHRHYVTLARQLASAGVAVLRYDYRGIGDSTGRFRGFEDLDDDIRAGIDALQQRVAGLERVVLWGLCESASAIAFYAHRDPRVAGIVLANPYASTAGGRARTMLRHYYLRRLFGAEFWRHLLSGRVAWRRTFRDLAGNLAQARQANGDPAEPAPDGDAGQTYRDLQIRPPERRDPVPLPERMAGALERFSGRILLVVSGEDLTAREFLAATGTRRWSAILRRSTATRLDLPGADHTFSRAEWLDRLADGAGRWLASLQAPAP